MSEIQHLRVPRDAQMQEVWVPWNSLLDNQHRIELCGDGKVVVNWCEVRLLAGQCEIQDFEIWSSMFPLVTCISGCT